MKWPDEWRFESVDECSFRLRAPGETGRVLEVWYSPLPGSLPQDEMDEWVEREAAKCRAESGMQRYLGDVWSEAGPSAVLEGLIEEKGAAEWHVQMYLAMPRVLLSAEYHQPSGSASALSMNLGSIKKSVDEAIRIFFSARSVGEETRSKAAPKKRKVRRS